MSIDKERQATIYVVIVVMLWATVASAFKITLKYYDFAHLLFYSSIASLLCLFIIILAQKKLNHIKNFSGRELISSLLLGALNPFLYYLVLFRAYSLLPAQEAQPLNYTWGIVVALLSAVFQNQKLNLFKIIALIISFSGVLIIATHGDVFSFKISNVPGFILAVGSSLIWALFWLWNVKIKQDAVLKLFLNFASGSLLIFLYLMVFQNKIYINFPGTAGAIYIGLFEMGITFVLWLKALSLTHSAARLGNIIYLSPFISLIFIYLVVGEQIRLSSIIGLIFIITGIILQQYKDFSRLK